MGEDIFDILIHNYTKTNNQELKQRLSRTSVSSDVDIDKIVKESKTTTITETRETIHFRPRRDSRRDVSSSSLEVPMRKRLSILDSSSDEKRAQKQVSPSSSSHYHRAQISRSCSRPTIPDEEVQKPLSDNDGDLAADYANLEKELKDINEKNKELRTKFFGEKSETAILSSPSPVPAVSARIQEWDSMSKRSGEITRREKKRCTFASTACDLEPETPGRGEGAELSGSEQFHLKSS
ncbi:hypothetical protein RB195_013937 [Necator americanus]|uniref:cGMP-dependent protein kinase interacting domain-containing protein n=1 Tax=Necator americanus TaxID=51031 RepID=A0ABR1DXU5_NECAM